MPVAVGEFQRDAPNVLIKLPLDDDGVGWFTACGHLYVAFSVIPGCGLGGSGGRGGGGGGGQEASAYSLRGSDRPAYSGTPITARAPVQFGFANGNGRQWPITIPNLPNRSYSALAEPMVLRTVGFTGGGMRQLLTALAVFISSPVLAGVSVTFPVSIPLECVELAQREGVPIVIENKYQATKAKIKLARLSGRDPLVRECRAAVERQRAASQ